MKKSILFFAIVMGLTSQANAQQKKLLVQPTIGVTAPILDGGIGFHLGVNPSIRITQRFSIEGQVSYMNSQITSSFLSGNVGSINSINTLAGGRWYLNDEEKTTRFFVNLLGGLNYFNEKIDNRADRDQYDVGASVGGFVELNKILIGLSYETPQNVVLKLGYSF